jgi:hypothetical protein
MNHNRLSGEYAGDNTGKAYVSNLFCCIWFISHSVVPSKYIIFIVLVFPRQDYYIFVLMMMLIVDRIHQSNLGYDP